MDGWSLLERLSGLKTPHSGGRGHGTGWSLAGESLGGLAWNRGGILSKEQAVLRGGTLGLGGALLEVGRGLMENDGALLEGLGLDMQ